MSWPPDVGEGERGRAERDICLDAGVGDASGLCCEARSQKRRTFSSREDVRSNWNHKG